MLPDFEYRLIELVEKVSGHIENDKTRRGRTYLVSRYTGFLYQISRQKKKTLVFFAVFFT